ncbi:hypothetical protein FN846DRAFT_907204 [Sphaerosporella brunnea]|uniref:Integral membrane protein n=1 Tax=Sphaerosporella brunnea TaxID=1250544 RepID=A0A5J5EXY1_9PEZI|nr:hypothetical protein FN846DRAFT_907204 [Sphaerosporella brunnea]
MASARLAIQIVFFTIAMFFHFARTFLDLLTQRVVPRSSTFWASTALIFYVATFGLDLWRRDDASSSLVHLRVLKAERFLTPAALWACKLSVVSTFPQVGIRRLVVWALQAYLSASFLALVLAYLQLCRPWTTVLAYCVGTPEIVTYTALNVVGYFFVMLVPLSIFIWRPRLITAKAATSVALLLGVALCAIAIVRAVITLNLVPHNTAVLPRVLVDLELSLALMVSSLPALWRHIFFHPPTAAVSPSYDTSKPPETSGEERELVTLGLGFNPRHLGVLPDSIHGSFRSGSGDTTPTGTAPQQELPDWQEESREALRDGAAPATAPASSASPHSTEREIWENDLEAGPRSPKSMGGS